MEFAQDRNRPETDGADDSYLEVQVPLGRSIFFRMELLVKHSHEALRRKSSARLRPVLTAALLAAVLSGGCATVDPHAKSRVSEATEAPPPDVTVRAQNDEPAPAAVPPTPIPNPVSNPSGLMQDEGVPGDAGTGPPTSAGPVATSGPLDTALESLFGEAPIADWTPLSFATLFTQGWNQPFVFSPASDGGALRQEWINAANGVFYRQWVLDYNFRDHATPSGNRDIGTWSIFAPLSRRLEMFISIPFVDYHAVANSPPAAGGQGVLNPHDRSPTYSHQATFGDITITPQVMLSETKNTSIMSILAIRTPTGSLSAGDGKTSIGPQIQFWQGLPNRWVVRGGAGPTIPLSSTGSHTTFDTNLTIGRFLTLDEVRFFKEFTVWVAVNNSAAMDHSGPAADTLTILPGIRFRIAKDTWFLYGVEIPLVAPRDEDFGMYFRLVRRW
jgi:Putative MetA-pathway of phenol degradation